MALDDLITAAAAAPAKMRTEGGESTSRTIDELIKADQYLRMCQAAAAGAFPFRVFRLVPPGTTGPNNVRDN